MHTRYCVPLSIKSNSKVFPNFPFSSNLVLEKWIVVEQNGHRFGPAYVVLTKYIWSVKCSKSAKGRSIISDFFNIQQISGKERNRPEFGPRGEALSVYRVLPLAVKC